MLRNSLIFVFLILTLTFSARRVSADSVTVIDTNTTSDSISATVNAGNGEIFTCIFSTELTPDFSCTDHPDNFTCFGFNNCEALGATPGWALDSNGNPSLVEQPITGGVPEPPTILLLALGVVLLIASSRKPSPLFN